MTRNNSVTKSNCNADKYEYICQNCSNEWYSPKRIKSLDRILNRKKYPSGFECKDQVIKNQNGTYEVIHISGTRNLSEKEMNEWKNRPIFKTIYRYTGFLEQCPRCIGNRKHAEHFRKENKLRKIRTDKKPSCAKRKTTRERVKRWRQKQKEVKP